MGARWIGLVLLSLLSGLATAADDHAVYAVEVVIFAYPAGSAEDTAETLPSAPDLSGTRPLPAETTGPKTEHRLDETWARLSDLPGYRPLLHLAWHQPLPDPSPGIPYRIEYPVDPAEGSDLYLLGRLQLKRQRSAFLEADLVLREQRRSYRLRQSERMNRNEVHYVDHPMLGLFATLTKLR
jgi:hypothetical protein